LRVERAGHRVAFVIVDSCVIHGGMSVVRLPADFHSAAHVACPLRLGLVTAFHISSAK
jgi:hypothetical protein